MELSFCLCVITKITFPKITYYNFTNGFYISNNEMLQYSNFWKLRGTF